MVTILTNVKQWEMTLSIVFKGFTAAGYRSVFRLHSEIQHFDGLQGVCG